MKICFNNLGMDPAFLVWIPPMDDETSMDDEIEPQYEEIQSNPSTDLPTPTEEIAPPLPTKHRKSLTNFSQQHQQNEEIKSLLSKSPSRKSIEVELRKSATRTAAIEIADNRMADYYGLSDIQFADDGDELDEEVRYIDEHKAHSHSSKDVKISETRYKV